MSTTTAATQDRSAILRQLQAVAEETRFEVVCLLADGERCVCELQDALGGAAQSRLSFHLKKLKEANVVMDRREGRWVYYSLLPEALEGIRTFLGDPTPGRAQRPEAGQDASCCS
jgi:ArsR family transcriptional regulator